METSGSQDVVTGFAELHERLTQALFVVCGCHNEVIDNLVDSLVSAAEARGEARGRAEMEVETKINAISQLWLAASDALWQKRCKKRLGRKLTRLCRQVSLGLRQRR